MKSAMAERFLTGSAAPHQSFRGLVFIPFLCCCSSPKSPDRPRTSCGALSADSCLYDSECKEKHRAQAQVRVKPGTNWHTLSSHASDKNKHPGTHARINRQLLGLASSCSGCTAMPTHTKLTLLWSIIGLFIQEKKGAKDTHPCLQWS